MIKHLSTGLSSNTGLLSLNLSHNRLENHLGARVLASALEHNKTLREIALVKNGITDDAIKELVQGLKNNTTLFSIDLGANPIGQNSKEREGAQALIDLLNQNHTLLQLNTWETQIRVHDREILKTLLEKNCGRKRDHFIQSMIVLARDAINSDSQSGWHTLPAPVRLHIVHFLKFQPYESIGKNDHQIYQCAKFILENISQLGETLKKANETAQDFKIFEKTTHHNPMSQFRFFPPLSPSSASNANMEENTEPARKIQKTM